ncbi:hypothetical protein ABIE13_003725 [Ottowia thiooxydans]|uniref:Uncharacterized protein n=1 Tax=Ottowia thiooxydans TaxID=219182 RepID=A0ABV2QC42_9BURK
MNSVSFSAVDSQQPVRAEPVEALREATSTRSGQASTGSARTVLGSSNATFYLTQTIEPQFERCFLFEGRFSLAGCHRSSGQDTLNANGFILDRNHRTIRLIGLDKSASSRTSNAGCLQSGNFLIVEAEFAQNFLRMLSVLWSRALEAGAQAIESQRLGN